MSPRTAEQNEAIRQQKRQQILDAALEVFAHDGYHSSSMSKVAKEAGISKGLTYSYFESKEELLKEVLLQGFQSLNVFSTEFPNGMDSKETAERMFDLYIEMIKSNGAYWKLYFSLVLQLDIASMFGPELMEMMGGVIKMISVYYEKQGCEDPMNEALLFGAMLDGVFMNYLLNPEFFDIDKIKKIMLQRFL